MGQSLWDAFPAAVGTEIEESYRRAVATGESVSFETYYPEPLNAWYDVRALPGPDGLSVFFLEVSERRLAQERAQTAGDRLALLAQVSSELAGALSSDAATRRLPAMLAPALADGCIVTVLDDRGHLVQATLVARRSRGPGAAEDHRRTGPRRAGIAGALPGGDRRRVAPVAATSVVVVSDRAPRPCAG